MDDELQLRAATLEDAPRLAGLQRLEGGGWGEVRWGEELRRPNSVVWLVEHTGSHSIIALLAMWRVLDQLEVTDVIVHPDWRQKGVAKTLLDTAISLASARDIRRIVLEVALGNTPARNLYEKLGFETVEVQPDFYEDGESAAVMVRDVGS